MRCNTSRRFKLRHVAALQIFSRPRQIALRSTAMKAKSTAPTVTAETTESGIHRLIHQVEEFVRQEPAKAVATALGAGLLLNLLPTRVIVGTLTAVAVPFMRPALFALGMIKACELCCLESGHDGHD